MPSIGPAELFVVFVIALVVLGPKRLPEVGRQIGRMMREFRQATSQVRSEMGLDDIAADVRDIRSTIGVEDMTRDMTRDVADVKQSFRIDAPASAAAAAPEEVPVSEASAAPEATVTAAAGALFESPAESSASAAESSALPQPAPEPPSPPSPPATT